MFHLGVPFLTLPRFLEHLQLFDHLWFIYIFTYLSVCMWSVMYTNIYVGTLGATGGRCIPLLITLDLMPLNRVS